MRRALVLLLLMASPALAQKAPHKEGEYGGVSPGEAPRPDPKTSRTKKPARGTLSWIGFEAKDAGAQVFFQSVAPFEATQHVEGQVLVVHLGLTRLGSNTWRPIDTRFFDNPLSRITAKKVRAARAAKGRPARSAGIEVRITFKNPVDVREGAMRSEAGPDGMHYVYLTFPAGTQTATPATNDPER